MKEIDIWINVHDDEEVRKNGLIRPYLVESRDPDVWTKTPREKRQLKKYKRGYKGHFYASEVETSPLVDTLIVYLSKNKWFDKPTYSFKCNIVDIPFIIQKFTVKNKSFVKKYFFNGKTYKNNEFPKWKY